mmetsp:Transcript_6080/g.14913  ORF Transcript_6080/g.14913 Transcript_6080/m.14913 type:complete len:280 (-) Transcript_6080:1367-2206(-)
MAGAGKDILEQLFRVVTDTEVPLWKKGRKNVDLLYVPHFLKSLEYILQLLHFLGSEIVHNSIKRDYEFLLNIWKNETAYVPLEIVHEWFRRFKSGKEQPGDKTLSKPEKDVNALQPVYTYKDFEQYFLSFIWLKRPLDMLSLALGDYANECLGDLPVFGESILVEEKDLSQRLASMAKRVEAVSFTNTAKKWFEKYIDRYIGEDHITQTTKRNALESFFCNLGSSFQKTGAKFLLKLVPGVTDRFFGASGSSYGGGEMEGAVTDEDSLLCAPRGDRRNA